MGGRRRVAALVAIGAAVAVLASACTPAQSNSAGPLDRAAEAKRATRELAAAQRQDFGCNNVVMSEEPRTTLAPEHLVLLRDAYAVAEPCWDKIVFTFEATGDDMPPGYDIEYCKPPFTDGPEGQFNVETLGDAFLCLTMKPAASYDTRVPGRPPQTYLGNLRLALDDMAHTEIVRHRMDGDGTVIWLIGLDTKRPFTVDGANNPPRVTVYIAR